MVLDSNPSLKKMYITLEVTNILKVEVNVDLHFDILLQGGQYDLNFGILQYH